MISSVKAKRFFVGCTNVNARLTSILIPKKSRSWGKSKRGKGGWGDIFSSHLLPSRQCLPQGLIYPLSPIFLSGKRSLSNDDGDVNENGIKAIGYIGKTTTLHAHHAFLYISLPSLHDYDVNMSNFRFCGGREHMTTTFFFFS